MILIAARNQIVMGIYRKGDPKGMAELHPQDAAFLPPNIPSDDRPPSE